MERRRRQREADTREKGNILIVSFLLVSTLAALAAAHVLTVEKNSRQSRFVNDLGMLRRYAESGVNLALHELAYKVGKEDGDIGTESWTTANDAGRDGKLGTADEGEGDGVPTPGEPNLVASAVGPATMGTGLLVRTTDTAWTDVVRIVSTASNPSAIATVEVYARANRYTFPKAGAIYLESNVSLDVNGNSFDVTGNDKNPDGTPVRGSQVPGIVTEVGDPPGTNSGELQDQVPAGRADQITGTGGANSITETDVLTFDEVWDWFMAAPKTTVAPGEYSSAAWGSDAANDYRVTYCKGDLELSGKAMGAGVLIVDGNLTMTGQSSFAGVILVRGDVNISGGGNRVHLYGTLMVGDSPANPSPSLTISGNSKVIFSSSALTKASTLIPPDYTILYWNDLK